MLAVMVAFQQLKHLLPCICVRARNTHILRASVTSLEYMMGYCDVLSRRKWSAPHTGGPVGLSTVYRNWSPSDQRLLP